MTANQWHEDGRAMSCGFETLWLDSVYVQLNISLILIARHLGERFGLTYSAVSQRVKITKENLKKDRALAKKFEQIKSIIKI